MIANLQLALKAAETTQSPDSPGGLSTEQFSTVLMEFFPGKQSDSIASLVLAAAAELNVTGTGTDPLLYDHLFTEVCTSCI